MKIIIALIISLLSFGNSYAFDNEVTHADITQKAVLNSNLKEYLRKNLNFPVALETQVADKNSLSIISWLQKGSTEEDSPACRASNHFHNPLEGWDQSYMSDEPFYIQSWCGQTEYSSKYSNVTWATGLLSPDDSPKSRPSQDMGWDDARRYYSWALTSVTPYGRELYFSKTFKALGQVMHMLQDMAVPAHVRNDFRSHLDFVGFKWDNPRTWFGSHFEEYIMKRPGLVLGARVDYPSFQKPKLTDFWDTDVFKKNGPPPTDYRTFGLAEYTNANFFSKSTIPNNNPGEKHRFSFPNASDGSYQICEDYQPNSMKKRKYLSRKRKGECPPISEARAADHFAAVSAINKGSVIKDENIPSLRLWMDGNVHNTYAQDLLPLAIGYSAKLIDYFFRGNIEITLPEDGLYSLTDNSGKGFERIKLLARNVTPDDEEMPEGSIQLVVHYKLAQEDPFQSKPVAVSEDFFYIVAPERKNLRSIPRDQGVLLEFDLTENPIPLNATDIYLQLVYGGKLGMEADAVAVGFKDISEPTPVDIFNDMDRSCVNGAWYVAGGAEVVAMFDFNADGIADLWDVYPHELSNTFIRFSRSDAYKPVAPDDYHLKIDKIAPGAFLRVGYLLSDYDYRLSFSSSAKPAHPDDRFWHTPGLRCPPDYHQHSPCLSQQKGVKNQRDLVTYFTEEECRTYNVSAPCTVNIEVYPSFDEFRGVRMKEGVIVHNAAYPPGVPAGLGCPQ